MELLNGTKLQIARDNEIAKDEAAALHCSSTASEVVVVG